MKHLLLLHLMLFSFCAFSQNALTLSMRKELNRNFEQLKKEEVPPYFISLRINDVTQHSLKSVYGNLTQHDKKTERRLCTSVRVGSYEFDNTREVRGDYNAWFDRSDPEFISNENAEEPIRQAIWKSIDTKYKAACNRLNQVKANVAVKVEGEDLSDDFSREKPVKHYEPPLDMKKIIFAPDVWKDRLRAYSAVFLDFPEIFDAEANLNFEVERKHFVSTEGSEIEENRTAARLFVSAKIKATDGMELPLHISYFAFLPENLPATETILADVKKMAETLMKLKDAPVAESYEGPAMLSGEAAGVFFHEIFGHRIEGSRLKLSTDGQTFKQKVNEEVLNKNLTVYFDPQQKTYDNKDLNGYYMFDEQGVKGQRVVIVDNGILKNFLMSRSPIENFSNSNGHGRAFTGVEPVSRQSNMFITSNNPIPIKDLKKRFKEELKSQQKEFGFFFDVVQGGFTMTGRFMPNSFNVKPLLVFRVYADDREDEIIRGVDLIGTPLAMFSQIILAGDDYGLFTGNCGAESGWVPVSTVSPSLVVKQIETQKNIKSQDRPFILPPPETDSNKM